MAHKKKTILAITGARSEYGILRPVLLAIRERPSLELRVLATGMHTLKKFGHTIGQIRRDGVRVDFQVRVGEGDDMLAALSKEITGITKYCSAHRPDLILVLGDRDEQFAGAIVAGHLNIPVAHIHGGDVSGPVVDEYIRHSITKFSHLHFCATPKSAKRVLLLGEEKSRVFCTGGPGIDDARSMRYISRPIFARKLGLNPGKKWFLTVMHPTPLDQVPFRGQASGVYAAMDKLEGEKILIYPNSDTGNDVFLAAIEMRKNRKGYHVFKTLPRADYLHLLKYSAILVGNSSSGIHEAGLFRLPVVNVGNRQNGRECGANVIHAGYKEAEIRSAIRRALSDRFRALVRRAKHPYGNGTAGKKIAAILARNIGRKDLLSKKFTYANI